MKVVAVGISRGLLGPIFPLALSASHRPVELQGLLLAWVGSWVQAVLPEWSSGFWIFPSLYFFQLAISSSPKMLRKLSQAALSFWSLLLHLIVPLVKDGAITAAAGGDLEPRDHEFLHFAAGIFSLMIGTQVAHPEQRLEAGTWKIFIFQY